MSTSLPLPLERIVFAEAAQQYLRSLPLEHFMEPVTQATQRRITLASLELVYVRRRDVQFFNELLVQYRLRSKKEIRQVVPDNMIVVHPEPLDVEGSYDVPIVGVQPFCMLEYVSKSTKRKDSEDNYAKYEKELKVPYYVLFNPDIEELSLFRHNRRRFVSVKPNRNGRLEMPRIDLEIALMDRWVRFWYQGQLLPLPADLQATVDQLQRELGETKQKLSAAE